MCSVSLVSIFGEIELTKVKFPGKEDFAGNDWIPSKFNLAYSFPGRLYSIFFLNEDFLDW